MKFNKSNARAYGRKGGKASDYVKREAFEKSTQNIVKVYSISKQEYERGEYRQNRETVDIETEVDWNYADIIRNRGSYADSYADVNCVVDCGDLYVWEIVRNGYVEDDQVFYVDDVIYVVELKKNK